jgi:hypothetical protein
VVGGLGSVGAKLNVVQKHWACVVACTSFNFCEALANFRFCQSVDILSECRLPLPITEKVFAKCGLNLNESSI